MMSGVSSVLRGVGVVILAIVEMGCGYHLLFWYWMTISAPDQLKVSEDHLHFWLTTVVIVGLVWMYLTWTLLMQDRGAGKKKPASIRKPTIPEP
jgi:heme/copper-type cytochrome/quinol oxidase subunit 2